MLTHISDNVNRFCEQDVKAINVNIYSLNILLTESVNIIGVTVFRLTQRLVLHFRVHTHAELTHCVIQTFTRKDYYIARNQKCYCFKKRNVHSLTMLFSFLHLTVCRSHTIHLGSLPRHKGIVVRSSIHSCS